MCGIAGIVKRSEHKETLATIAQDMASAIEHRGPDSEGVWCSPSSPLALSHRRLSIIDLSPLGSQPMQSQSTQSTIAFNGEIYNFKKLRKEVEATGFTFKSESDTEVLLEAIEHFGFDTAIQQAKGMFAIAHWDETNKILNLARDRIGEKPLYYGVIQNTLVFASEIKAILKVFPANSLSINQQALNSFFRYGYISAPDSIFSEIKKLPPGFQASISIGEWLNRNDDLENHINLKNYWNIENFSSKSPTYREADWKDALSDLDTTLNTIIQEQAIADVPLGSFLSGGIDSSLVSAALQAQSSRAIDTFTIGFHEKAFNEAEHAKKIAAHIGSNHNELYLTAKDALDVIPALPDIYDEPFADASQIPTFLVSQFAKSKLTVCLSGDGGDELFAGYNRYIEGQKFRSLANKVPSILRVLAKKSVTNISPHIIDNLYQAINALLRRQGGANFGVKAHKAVEALGYTEANGLYQYLCSYNQQPSQLLLAPTQDLTLEPLLSFEKDFISAGMAWDQQWYLPGDNLVKSDRASMATSLEMRVPLLDKDLIEFSWRVPNTLKYRDGKSKWLLRQLLYKYVPQKMIDRPKMGFSIPISQWIREDLRAWSHDLLSEESIRNQAIFNPIAIQKLMAEHQSGKFDHGNKLWTILMFQSWYLKYCQQ